MGYFVGLDVSLRSCALCIVDGKGSIHFEQELDCEVDAIAKCLATFAHPIERVGFEAGTLSQHLFFLDCKLKALTLFAWKRDRLMLHCQLCATRPIKLMRVALLKFCELAGLALCT